ncbi:DNA-binding transcriptional regulator, LysR family [Paenibacillus algorifonticola]|uniref:DNA-binding transcriptional regulator, LysR family n=1 Tax=Paenibacillus algorifonticola TaxID=684063 RepID=A0A1I2C0J0_9BACL|nr:LysR family transcriptional regulator [Paenibacillus algorifonticola]SFE61080.1 DNA-binding transcriptional regulator, LysR family [Paenibacillus algorifonticola]
MEDRDWLILNALYKHKNITKTAQSLFMSQPALTSRLQQIEKEFGVTMVQRGRRGVDFTPQGEYMVKTAEEMLKKYQKIKDDLLNMENRVTGTLRLGVGFFFTKNKLPTVLKMFKEQYPDVEYKVIAGQSKAIHQLIFNQDVHIGFIRGDYAWNEEKHFLFQDTLCIVSKNEIQLDELPYRPRIDYKTDYVLKASIDNWWAENYSVPPLVGMEVDQIDACREMIVNGLGYAIMPSMYFHENLLTKVEIKNKEGKPIIRYTWMFYHEESMQLNVVKAFVNFVKQLDFQKIL